MRPHLRGRGKRAVRVASPRSQGTVQMLLTHRDRDLLRLGEGSTGQREVDGASQRRASRSPARGRALAGTHDDPMAVHQSRPPRGGLRPTTQASSDVSLVQWIRNFSLSLSRARDDSVPLDPPGSNGSSPLRPPLALPRAGTCPRPSRCTRSRRPGSWPQGTASPAVVQRTSNRDRGRSAVHGLHPP